MFSIKRIFFLLYGFHNWHAYLILHNTNALNKHNSGKDSLVPNALRIQPESLLHNKEDALNAL